MPSQDAEAYFQALAPAPAPASAAGGAAGSQDGEAYFQQFAPQPAARGSQIAGAGPATAAQNTSWYRPLVLAGQEALRGGASLLSSLAGPTLPGQSVPLGPVGMSPAGLLANAFAPARPGPPVPSIAQTAAPWLAWPGFTPGQGPHPELENLQAAGIEGAIGAIPMALAGVPPLGAGALGAAGGLAAEATNELAPGHPLLAGVAGLAPGLLAAGASGLLGKSELQSLAEGLGTSKTLQEAGEKLQPAAQEWFDKILPAKEAAVWQPLDAAMHSEALPKGPITPLTNFRSALQAITSQAGELSGVAAKLQPKLAAGLLEELDKVSGTGIGPSRALASGAPTYWDNVRQIRTMLGKAMTDPSSELSKSLGQQNLEHLYAGITQDLGETAAANGAGPAFTAANAESSRLRGIGEESIAPLVAPKVTPGAATTAALRNASKDGARLADLRAELPDAVNELASAHLLQTPRGWARLSPEAQAALVPDPTVRARIGSAVARALGQPSEITKLGREMVGGSVGEMLGVLGSHLTGAGELVGGATGGLAGMVAPPVLRATGVLVGNPGMLRLPAASGLGARNALVDQGQ